jgi:hypothetical protein
MSRRPVAGHDLASRGLAAEATSAKTLLEGESELPAFSGQ